MYKIFTCGLCLELPPISKEIAEIFSKDPFFPAHLPNYRFFFKGEEIDGMRQCKEYKQLIKKISPLFFQKEQLVHIPFFILSLLAKELAKEDKYLIHGACIIINDSLIIIIGPPETGKSSVLLKLLSKKVDKKIYHASDDKFVFDAYKNQILYSNEILSFRDKNLIKSIKKYQKVDILKSRFTDKYYVPVYKSKLNKSIKKILFFKLHLNNVSLVSKKQKSKDFVIDFYGNIVSHIKGVEACSLSPSLVDNQNISDNLSFKILDWLKKWIGQNESHLWKLEGNVADIADFIRKQV